MDINEILGLGGHAKRPEHPDFYRVLEISMAMKANMTEHEGDPAKQEELWRKSVADVIDLESLNYHAMQSAIQALGMRTGLDFALMKHDPDLHLRFVQLLQMFYDGFLFGAEFQKRGGHQEPS